MPYTVKFLDDKLYQSLSFDADIKFQASTEYAKKIWLLIKYKSQGGAVELAETIKEDQTANRYSSFSLNKSFENNELVVEVIQHYTLQDHFDFFEKTELEDDTGDEGLNKVLAKIKESDFSEHLIKNLLQECVSDCECNCESE
tara:strand:+ start:1045 stop:1473 length:429 start_codon:yes stop_codon:yes gene_type:complete